MPNRVISEFELSMLLEKKLILQWLEERNIDPTDDMSTEEWDKIKQDSVGMLNKYERFGETMQRLVKQVEALRGK